MHYHITTLVSKSMLPQPKATIDDDDIEITVDSNGDSIHSRDGSDSTHMHNNTTTTAMCQGSPVDNDGSSFGGQSPILDCSMQELNESIHWNLADVQGIYTRRYMIQQCGIEIYFEDFSPEVFFIFKSPVHSSGFFKMLGKHASSLINLRTPLGTLVPKQVIAQLNWTDLWRRRLISNFEYLMRLNILAGRSFNDIGMCIFIYTHICAIVSM